MSRLFGIVRRWIFLKRNLMGVRIFNAVRDRSLTHGSTFFHSLQTGLTGIVRSEALKHAANGDNFIYTDIFI